MTEVLFVNEAILDGNEIAKLPVTTSQTSMSRRHAIAIAAEAFRNHGIIVFHDNSTLYWIPTTLGTARNALDDYIQGLGKPTDAVRTCMGSLPEEQQKRLLLELIIKGASVRGVYRAYHSTLFRPNARTAAGWDAASVQIRRHSGDWHAFIEPCALPTEALDGQLDLDEEPLLCVCQRLRECPERESGEDCPLTPPGHIGYFAGLAADTATALFEDSDRPGLRCRRPDCQSSPYVLVKPTRKSTGFFAVQPFLLHRLVRRSRSDAEGQTEYGRVRASLPSAARYEQTRRWTSHLFPGDVLQVGDLQIPVEDCLRNPLGLTSPGDGSSDGLYYPETALRFRPLSSSGQIVDQKWGLDNIGPYDQSMSSRPFKEIEVRLIVPDDPRIVEQAQKLMEFLASGYAARPGTRYPDTPYKGMSKLFKAPLRFDPQKIIRVQPKLSSYEDGVREVTRSWYMSRREPGVIALVVVPSQYPTDVEWTMEEDPYLRAKSLLLSKGLPSQMIEVGKLAGVVDEHVPLGHLLWTLALDMYVKLGGKPWTLQQSIENVGCLVGIGFGLSPYRKTKHIYAGVASVFDHNGEWLRIVPEQMTLSDREYEDLGSRRIISGSSSYKIAEGTAYRLVKQALELYGQTSSQRSDNQSRRQVVIHKNGPIHDCEANGFMRAIAEHMSPNVLGKRFALVSVIKNHGIRLYGNQDPNQRMNRTVTRGAAKLLDDNTAVISTSGKILISRPTKSWYNFQGVGTPEPLLLERYLPQPKALQEVGLGAAETYSIHEIAEQVLALTRLHWGTMRTDVRLPVTSLYAQKVAAFIAHADLDDLDLSQMWDRLWCI